MPGEFSNPDYINPGGAVGSGSAAIITATQATRLALLLENASGRLIKQTSDSSVWCLKPDGLPANLADWELLGYYTADAAKPVSTAQAAAITAAQAAAQAAAALDATTKADAAQAAAALDATTKAAAAQAAALEAAALDAAEKVNAALVPPLLFRTAEEGDPLDEVQGVIQEERFTISGFGANTGTLALQGTVMGAPANVWVPLVSGTHTTTALIAEAVRTAIDASSSYSSYVLTRSASTVILRRLVAAANDPTLSLSLAFTSLGVSAFTSVNTVAGVAPTAADPPFTALNQQLRVGPYPLEAGRTEVYDWFTCESSSPATWRKIHGASVTSFESLEEKPTTLAGYGITDAAPALTRTALQGVPVNQVLGVAQIETVLVAGAVTVSGDALVSVHDDTGSGEVGVLVPVLAGDSDVVVAAKSADVLAAILGDTPELYTWSAAGASLVATRKLAAANNPLLNISVNNSTCAGITPALASSTTAAGVAALAASPLPAILGQPCIVTHSDGSETEWVASQLVPAKWLPRTAGILYNRSLAQWERTYIADGTLQTEILPDQ